MRTGLFVSKSLVAPPNVAVDTPQSNYTHTHQVAFVVESGACVVYMSRSSKTNGQL
jgi:hypothetical protein